MNSTKTLIGIAVFIIFCVGAGIIIADHKNNDATSTTPNTVTVVATPATTGTTTSNSSTPVTSSYKDGTFQATGSYDSPAGTESVAVSLTLKDGIIESSTVTSEANDGESRRYQGMFISGYKAFVDGKNISDVNVGKVSGSSLTGIGFNAAVAKIKAEAAA